MANILDKEEKTFIRMPNRDAKVDKVKRYSWADDSSPGFYMEIDKTQLNIDGRYQREMISLSKVTKIAREFDWKLFGAISVTQRSDGSFWVFDGGHRVRSTFHRSDINKIPCLVFRKVGLKQEAKAFIGIAKTRNNITPYIVHKAGVVAEEPTAIKVKRIVEKYGYELTDNGSDKYGLKAISAFESIVQIDEELAEKIFKLCVYISENGEQFPSDIMRGLFILERNMSSESIFNDYISNKLKTIGLKAIKIAITREKYYCGKGGGRVAAKAILDLINKNRKKKITM